MGTLSNAETAIATALAAITWTIPAGAATVENAKATSFNRIDTQYFGDQVDGGQLPYVRAQIHDIHNNTLTQGSDAGSLKIRKYPIFLYMYWATWSKNWKGGGQYFHNIVDATMDYFNAHRSAPGQGGVAAGQPSILGWNLISDARIEVPERYGDYLYFRASVGLETTEVTI